MAYCTVQQVSTYLGRALTAAQQNAVALYLPFAVGFIDRETNRSWLTAPITDEQYSLWQSTIYLNSTPVATVERVNVRTGTVGDAGQTLTEGVDYELQDPQIGRLVLTGGWASSPSAPSLAPPATTNPDEQRGGGLPSYALVSYTPNAPVPAEISMVATMLVAHWMIGQIDPDRFGAAEYKMADEISITVDDPSKSGAIPPAILHILSGWRRQIIV